MKEEKNGTNCLIILLALPNTISTPRTHTNLSRSPLKEDLSNTTERLQFSKCLLCDRPEHWFNHNWIKPKSKPNPKVTLIYGRISGRPLVITMHINSCMLLWKKASMKLHIDFEENYMLRFFWKSSRNVYVCEVSIQTSSPHLVFPRQFSCFTSVCSFLRLVCFTFVSVAVTNYNWGIRDSRILDLQNFSSNHSIYFLFLPFILKKKSL